MKVAVYIAEGVTQLVLTPENEWEKNATSSILADGGELTVHRGEFWDCRGGWVRHTPSYSSGMFGEGSSGDRSFMLTVRPKATQPEVVTE